MSTSSQIKWKFQWPYIVMAVASALFLIIEKEAFRTYFLGFIYGLALIVAGMIYTRRYKMYEPLLAMGWSGLALWHYFLAARPADKTFSQISHISFSKSGEIVVHVSKQDYRMYQNQLTFDQLCMALSNLFRQFFEYYKNGNEDRILTELKSI